MELKSAIEEIAKGDGGRAENAVGAD